MAIELRVKVTTGDDNRFWCKWISPFPGSSRLWFRSIAFSERGGEPYLWAVYRSLTTGALPKDVQLLEGLTLDVKETEVREWYEDWSIWDELFLSAEAWVKRKVRRQACLEWTGSSWKVRREGGLSAWFGRFWNASDEQWVRQMLKATVDCDPPYDEPQQFGYSADREQVAR